MKLASVEIGGEPRFGAFTERGFVDLTAQFGARCTDLRQFLAAGLIGEAERLLLTAPAIPVEGLAFERVIPNLDARMFALGWSYKDHQLETGKDAPTHPFIFSKHPQSMVGHGRALHKPRASQRYDFEGEIAVVIGKAGRHISSERAMDHIAGYTIVMDGSARDWQQHSITAGKNFDASSAYGPWLITRDEIADPGQMELVTRINGTEMQRTSFALMAWKLEELVAYVSTICRLEVGDSISTGTPAGVGNRRDPPLYLAAGDVLTVEVSGIGVLSNPVIDEPPSQ